MATRKTKKPPPNKAVQVSIPPAVLKAIDAQTGPRGRSAFIVQAILLALREKKQQRLRARLLAAYAGKADELYAQMEPFLPHQVWSLDDDLVEEIPSGQEKEAR